MRTADADGGRHLSGEVQKLLLAAALPSTLASYNTAVQHYYGWCARWRHDPSPSAITTHRALEWLAAVAAERGLMHSSFRSYRSALSTAWANAGGTGPNPLQDPLVSRLLKGYRNQRRPDDSAVREKRKETISLTVELLADLTPHAAGARGGTPDDIMVWAAACMLTFGLNRAGEIFRCTRTGRKAITVEAITFFAHAQSAVSRPLCPEGVWQTAAVPDHYSVALGITKADQEGINPDQRIAAVPAVQALWRWMHIRRDLGGGVSGPLFIVPGSPPLTRERLYAAIAKWHSCATGETAKVTGKAFRRGGNQSLLAAGAPVPELQHAGRWRGSGMPAVYSSAAANSSRALLVSRGLGELFTSASAAHQL